MSSVIVVGQLERVERRESRGTRRSSPARLTPTPTVLRHRWRRPARQLRQWPQVMWPSPETRSPICEAAHLAADLDDLADVLVADVPSAPGSSSAPSRPSCRCGCRCRRSRSCAILISTSLGPTSGSGDVLHPDAGLGACALTSAFMVRRYDHARARGRPWRTRRPRGRAARGVCAADICVRMRALPLRHHREGEADRRRCLRSSSRVGHRRGERRVAEHHRDDRVLARHELEARFVMRRAEVRRVARTAARAARRRSRAGRAPSSEAPAIAGGSVLENRYGRERWRSQSTISLRAGGVAAATRRRAPCRACR